MDTKSARKSFDANREKYSRAATEKEEKLRLKWFMANEENLNAAVQAPLQRHVPEDVRQELNQYRFLHDEKFGRREIGEPEPPVVDPEALQHVMRPVDPDTRRLLYAGERDGRRTYLKERVNLIPERRYYCPEVTSFSYGWNMWDHAKTRPNYGFGRSQVIKGSFYRRRGTERDPDWYTKPARLSPTTCL